MMNRLPHPLVATIPLVVLIGLLAVIIALFGSDSLSGGSQVSLLAAMAVCVFISMVFYRNPWKAFEAQIEKTVGGVAVMILILLAVGMLAGAWMISGVVPTLIYYGVQMLSPQFFLVCACVICALVSLLSGSSWTTIATIGVALLGISHALGINEAIAAGAIISGAYFGDKMSPLSDTTILASSSAGVDIFSHIRYMMLTTMPAFLITLLIFTAMGLGFDADDSIHVHQYTEGLSKTFNISLWTLLVPVLTGVLIVKRAPSLIVLFLSAMMAGVMALILQPHILTEIAGDAELSRVGALTKGLVMTFYGPTAIETGSAELNDLVSTGGMAGMLNTIWLIVCAMCFGAAMVASGMIESITKVVISWVRSRVGLVASTASTGLFLNVATGDQFISIVLTVNMFKDVYKRQGYEARLVSRTAEDSATVTSVLVPWNTCGLTQSTVLGVATIAYLPYCFFNILSPLMTILVAAVGWKIRRKMRNEK
ncbi:sodium:proton antiporter [Prevotella sp. E15-22]|uniref:Na+/H+ antiporter NhaC family protein n=1 Tax=Prevotella sp. E15-22 TaxID=2937774 RepID=UPI002057A839|nr:Na+/H+ antiporter NhaC family protein [Prevotella sp. E15-22]UPS45443.1 sodium:proton antiporter [Prevotella sp. E15-22]